MIRIGILGATGYTALELIKILLRHPETAITVLTSRQEGGPHVAKIHPQLTNRLDLHVQDMDAATVAARTDCVFSCLPHAASAAAVMELASAGRRVIDFSADYRLDDAETYAQWYGHTHPDPKRLGETVYGLPELFKERIIDAQVVANPGCYPTSAILPLAPLLAQQVIDADDLIIDSKSGVSGAGRSPKLTTHFPECNESVSAYNVGQHRHTPEIEQVLRRASGREVKIVFTPHLIPMDRGILTTAYARPIVPVTEESVLALCGEFYAAAPFVRVVDHLPAVKDVVGSNYCDMTVRLVRNRLVLISCIDNLIKGASGAAVQNFNLMHGFAETTAL